MLVISIHLVVVLYRNHEQIKKLVDIFILLYYMREIFRL
jgi:hypothetical protein